MVPLLSDPLPVGLRGTLPLPVELRGHCPSQWDSGGIVRVAIC